MTIIDNLKWRYAVQKFDTSKQLPEADLQQILEAGNLAATAYGLQPFTMVLVEKEEVRTSLIEHAYGQTHFGQNSLLIVLAARTDIDEAYISEFTARTEGIRGLPAGTIDGYKQVIINDLTNRTPEARLHWAKEQAYIALGTMMAAASELRIDNHAMTGFSVEKFNEILGFKEKNLDATVALALGYRAEDDDWQHYAKVRKELDDIVVRI
ncbi:MAG: NAD(P)H-dependent oxidoreductase [Candidatus Paceibacteria bacterium]